MGGMSRWLDVEAGTDDIDINSLPSNLVLCDLQNDNEFKLIIGDLGKGGESAKLKVSQLMLILTIVHYKCLKENQLNQFTCIFCFKLLFS